ncbi:hypothetical protein ACS0TY_013592 [Phlomoides rotata]
MKSIAGTTIIAPRWNLKSVTDELSTSAQESFVVGTIHEHNLVAKESWADIAEKEVVRKPSKHDSKKPRNNLRPNIWLFGKSEHFDNSRILHSSDQCILLETTAHSHTWCFGFVHARSTHIPRRELWTDISDHANRSLCIMGDFNVVLGAHERSRGAQNPAHPSKEFRAFLDEVQLHDMETSGPQFTWVTRRSNHGYMAARIDRVLVNDGFLDLWHSVSATVLPCISSDHHPILLKLQETAGHYIHPFRFQNMWSTHPTFTPYGYGFLEPVRHFLQSNSSGYSETEEVESYLEELE